MSVKFVYFINVPLNDDGVHELESCNEELVNVHTFELTGDEYEVLSCKGGLFEQFNEKFGIIIDLCEEEIIELCQLKEAIGLTKEKINKSKNPLEINACYIVLDSLVEAQKAKTYWEMDVYVERSE